LSRVNYKVTLDKARVIVYSGGMKQKQLVFNLDQILKDRGLSIEKASEITGLSRPTLYDMRANRLTGVTLETLSKLCNALNVEPNDLLLFNNGGAKKA
jgi:putative transcriptional regulator